MWFDLWYMEPLLKKLWAYVSDYGTTKGLLLSCDSLYCPKYGKSDILMSVGCEEVTEQLHIQL